MEEEKNLNINWDFCLKITVVILLLYFLFVIKNLIIWVAFALILSILFNFFIDFLEKIKIPRILGAFIIYFGIFILLGFFLYKITPLLILEIKEFTSSLPIYFQKITPFLEKIGFDFSTNLQSFLNFIKENLGKITENVFSGLIVLFGGIKALVFIFFLAFFLSLEKQFLEKLIITLAPKKHHFYFFNFLNRAKKQVSGWFICRLIGVLFVGLLSYLVLSLLKVKYALAFSILFAIFDFIPLVGPIVAGTLIVFMVMADSLPQALLVLVSLIIIQQLENYLLFPFLFKKIISLSPVLVLIALAIGGTFWGVLGAILAIPLAGIIFEVIKDYLKLREKEGVKSEVEIL